MVECERRRGEKEREGWGERDGDESDLDLVLQARMMIEEEEIPL